MQNAPKREPSAILLTFIKLPFVIKIFVLSIFEWPIYTGFTVQQTYFLDIIYLRRRSACTDTPAVLIISIFNNKFSHDVGIKYTVFENKSHQKEEYFVIGGSRGGGRGSGPPSWKITSGYRLP